MSTVLWAQIHVPVSIKVQSGSQERSAIESGLVLLVLKLRANDFPSGLRPRPRPCQLISISRARLWT